MIKLATKAFICTSLLFSAHADKGALRHEQEPAFDARELAAALSTSTAKSANATTPAAKSLKCVDYKPQYGSGPNDRECTDTSQGHTYVYRATMGFDKGTDNKICVHYDGKPCRGSSFCSNGNLAIDCRNLFTRGTACAAVGCDGKCISYPATGPTLPFSYSNNKCGRMGWSCVGVGYYGLASCYYVHYLAGGTAVSVSTNEPGDDIGQPSSYGYYGECYAKVKGSSCTSCKIKCLQTGGNYAQFDCTNLAAGAKEQCPAV
jgi:hypothetical protein